MKEQQAVEQFLAGRRVVIAKFVAHRYKEVQNKARHVVGIVNLYEVQCADGKAPTVQVWCPRSVQTVEQAAKECPCQFKDGQKLVVEFDLMEPNTFDAKNGVMPTKAGLHISSAPPSDHGSPFRGNDARRA